MNTLEIKLKNRIMRRVYAVWVLRKVLSKAFLRAVVFTGLIVEFVREVSVQNVINNLPSVGDMSANLKYFSYAFSHTEISVQVYIASMIIIAGWFLADRLFNKHQGIQYLGSRI